LIALFRSAVCVSKPFARRCVFDISEPSRKMSRPSLVLIILLIAAPFVVRPAVSADLETLEIATKSGVHVFAVEVARTDADRAKGMMFRRELAEGRGMLFEFEPERPIAMWMKNT